MSNRGRRTRRLAGSFAILAMFATLVPIVALATSASAAAPPVQDITAFCAGGPTGNPFPDVVTGDPFFAEVSCAKDAGVVNGKDDGNFHENEGASRAQESSIAARQADTMVSLAEAGQTLNPLPAPGSNPFEDVGDPPSNGGPSTAPHTPNILRLNGAGIIEGKTPTIFDPSAGITRFQFVKIEVLKLEFVTGATLDDTCGASFADGAENDGTFGTFVKKANCAGIIQGKGDGGFHGGDFQSRGQTAAETMRGMAWANGMGFITPLHGNAPTALFNVTPTDSATNALGAARNYTVTGLDAGNYNIVLFNCGYVTANPDGTFSFPFGTNPNTATNNNAQTGPTGTAFISQINNTPNTGPVNQFAVQPNNGTITFSVNTPAAPTNGAGACVTPVVFNGSNGTLELGANNQPSTDMYGVGGTTFFVPTAASSGPLAGNGVGGSITVQTVNRTAKQFIGCNNFTPDPNTGTANAGPGTFANCFLYTYKAGDNLTVTDPFFGTTKPASLTGSDGACPAGSTCFDSFLSAYDTVTGTYSADPNANSTLTLRDSAPNPVTGLVVIANPAGAPANQVTLQFNDSGTPSAATYLAFRALATDNGASASPRFTCPVRNIAKFPNTAAPATTNPTQPAENDYTLLGAVSDTDPSGATNRQYQFADPNAPAGQALCYAIVVLDGPSAHITFLGGGLGAPTNAGNAIPGAVAGAPKIQNAMAQDTGTIGILDINDTVQLVMNEPMRTNFNGFFITVQDGDATPSVGTFTCGGNATCALQQADTYNGVVAVKNQVLRMTITGAPTNVTAGTVANLQYPLTIQNLGSGWTDADENLAIDLAGSPDKTIDAGALSPAPGNEKTGMTGGTANATTQTVTITYTTPIQCTGAVPGQFVANPGVPGGGQSAATLACANPGGVGTVTLTFAAGTITNGVPATIVYNQAANQVDRIHKNLQPLVDAVSPDQITTPNATVNGAPAPIVSSVNPTSGPTTGGNIVNVNGSNFQNGASVTFCGTAAGVNSVTPTVINVTAPAHAAGACPVVVTNPDLQASNATVNYTYNAGPTITSLSRTSGSPAGGPALTITGTGFQPGATVDFCGNPGTATTVTPTTSITTTPPAHAPGPCTVTVTNPAGPNQGTSNGVTYTYIAPTFDSITGQAGTNNVQFNFNEAVCFNAGIVQPTDISILVNGVSRTLAGGTVCNTMDQSQDFTITGAALVAGDVLSATITASGAAKVQDANGTLMTNQQPTGQTRTGNA